MDIAAQMYGYTPTGMSSGGFEIFQFVNFPESMVRRVIGRIDTEADAELICAALNRTEGN